MTKENVIIGVKEAITESSNATFGEIKLNDNLSKYVPPVGAQNLALAICSHFNDVDINDLLNSLFDSINKVSDLINYICEIYGIN